MPGRPPWKGDIGGVIWEKEASTEGLGGRALVISERQGLRADVRAWWAGQGLRMGGEGETTTSSRAGPDF